MKKRGFFFISLLLLIAVTACGKKEEEPAQSSVIPENGRVEKRNFEQIKKGEVAVFSGNDQSISYQWLFMGDMQEKVQDENLKVHFFDTQADVLKEKFHAAFVQGFSFETAEKIHSNPTLTIYLSQKWAVSKVQIFSAEKKEIIASARIENAPNAVITFIPADFTGKFYLLGIGEEKKTTLAKPEEKTTETKKVTNEKKQEETKQAPAEAPKESAPEVRTEKRKPTPPEKQTVEKETFFTATLSIKADTLLKNKEKLVPEKRSLVPKDGVIMATRTVQFSKGESVFDVLLRETRKSKIHMEFSNVPVYNSTYIEGIQNLYEFDAGELSGWVYKVNGWSPNYGASQYVLKQGDAIEWLYTVDLGKDVGGYVPETNEKG